MSTYLGNAMPPIEKQICGLPVVPRLNRTLGRKSRCWKGYVIPQEFNSNSAFGAFFWYRKKNCRVILVGAENPFRWAFQLFHHARAGVQAAQSGHTTQPPVIVAPEVESSKYRLWIYVDIITKDYWSGENDPKIITSWLESSKGACNCSLGVAKLAKYASKRFPARIWPKTAVSQWSQKAPLNCRPGSRQMEKRRKATWTCYPPCLTLEQENPICFSRQFYHIVRWTRWRPIYENQSSEWSIVTCSELQWASNS